MYRVGLPGWKIAARLGVPILIPLHVVHDKDARVHIVTSPNLRGLVVEMPATATAEELHGELNACVDMLMLEILSRPPKSRPVTAWPGDFAPA
jgi:hypothetical protein